MRHSAVVIISVDCNPVESVTVVMYHALKEKGLYMRGEHDPSFGDPHLVVENISDSYALGKDEQTT